MKQYNKSEILFSIHIPKTAGTSFVEILRQWFYPGLHAHYFDHQYGRMPRKIHFVKKILHQLNIYPLCIHGHFEDEVGVFETYPMANQFITIVRDPLEMQISLFYDHQRRLKEQGALYWKGKKVDVGYDGDIDRWVEERPSYLLKFFPWNLNENTYLEIINKNFVHIGITEDMESSLNILAEKLNKRKIKPGRLNASERFKQPSNSSIKIFREKHELEYLIYEYALKLNQL